ncbi:similar to Saccharomyces cerevisiae YHL027W RIM101 Transcriptional repressor involved in response to pH and in cell wall construction [Maudiozyma saulgeensis]|uniref:Similar to Saccharomyces cerevisiae YHL027W RIM101 Transcriptional repressor involved in response to pH and in cell wall construction n=1 Tax=Maudiozyma saulgeensis TaxID=1789683 RepID=A0A1X7R437_9SACH|nr:similar to Saccharomyces cerevisiae YHL027W RIM101 Transcriptional repressor involved in response to pH and in cell wall construction [Kazachstania saulgeensis]
MTKLDNHAKSNLVPLHDLLNNAVSNTAATNKSATFFKQEPHNLVSLSSSTPNDDASSPNRFSYKSEMEVTTPPNTNGNDELTHSAISPISEDNSPTSNTTKLNNLNVISPASYITQNNLVKVTEDHPMTAAATNVVTPKTTTIPTAIASTSSSIEDTATTSTITSSTISVSKYNQTNNHHNLPSPTCSQTGSNKNDHISDSGSSTPTSSSGINNNDIEPLILVCKWDHCNKQFSQPELLYHHLCQDHVGRKSQRNLQLDCHWDNCQTKTEKRDHITSHIRVHIPLKPFSCSSCSKKFKRPQDLKKHLKIHLESGTITKRKRGPKVGSKRVNKQSPSTNVSSSSVTSTIEQRSRSLPSTAMTSLPHLNNGFRKFITNDIQSYQPVLTNRLDNQLQMVMGQTMNGIPTTIQDPRLYRTVEIKNSNNASTFPQERVSPSAVMDSLPPQVATNAAGFFSDLSNSMVSNATMYQHRSIPLQSQPTPILNGYAQLPPLNGTSYPQATVLEVPLTAGNTNNKMTILPSMSDVQGLQPRYQQIATDSWGRAAAGSNTNVISSYPLIPGMVHHQPTQPSMNIGSPSIAASNTTTSTGAAATSLPYALPNGLVVNAIPMNGSTLNMVENRYSSIQRSTGHDDELDDDEEHDEETFEEKLEFVNIIRDYLMCTLLEDEYDEETDDIDDSIEEVINNKFWNNSNNDLISKYPTVAV